MQVKNELVKYCHKVYSRGLVSATDGNLSARSFENIVYITASGVSKGEVNSDDIISLPLKGNVVKSGKKPSTEYGLHLYIYRTRPDVHAVVHCHPVYATAMSSSNQLDRPYFPEVILTLGRIPLCRYAAPSTSALYESLAPYIGYVNVFLLENHGAVTVGSSLKEAYHRMEKLEHYAKTLYLARQAGGIRELERAHLNELYSLAESVYGISLHPQNRF